MRTYQITPRPLKLAEGWLEKLRAFTLVTKYLDGTVPRYSHNSQLQMVPSRRKLTHRSNQGRQIPYSAVRSACDNRAKLISTRTVGGVRF